MTIDELTGQPEVQKTNQEFIMQFRTTRITQALVAGGVLLASNIAFAGDAEVEALRKTIQELDQKIRVIERKNEIAAEEAAAAKKTTPVIVAGDKGFALESADKKFQFRLSGLLQADQRTFFDDDREAGATGTNLTDDYLLRRVRPTFQGTLYRTHSSMLDLPLGSRYRLVSSRYP
jgi:phosphate-selective porin OprO/OprP